MGVLTVNAAPLMVLILTASAYGISAPEPLLANKLPVVKVMFAFVVKASLLVVGGASKAKASSKPSAGPVTVKVSVEYVPATCILPAAVPLAEVKLDSAPAVATPVWR